MTAFKERKEMIGKIVVAKTTGKYGMEPINGCRGKIIKTEPFGFGQTAFVIQFDNGSCFALTENLFTVSVDQKR